MKTRLSIVLATLALLVLTSCSSPTALMAKPSATRPSPTPVATFPPIGEWEYVTENFAMVLDTQQANSTTSMASMTSLIKYCKVGYQTIIKTYSSAATVSSTGNNVNVSTVVYWPGPLELEGWITHSSSVTFAGTINANGSLSLVSSGINGLHDYLFISGRDAVAGIQSVFQQSACTA